MLVYTGDHPLMNLLGALYIRVMSWFTYLVLSDDMARGDKAALRLTIGLGLAVFVAYGLALQAPFVVCMMAVLVLCKPGPPMPLVKAGRHRPGVFAGLVAAGVLMVPLLENYAAAGVLLTALVLFVLFYRGRLRANPLTMVLVLAFTLIPVAGVPSRRWSARSP